MHECQDAKMTAIGPLIDVLICPPFANSKEYREAVHAGYPNHRRLKAIIDTGANRTVILPGIAQSLSLTQIDENTSTLVGHGSTILTPLYRASLVLPGKLPALPIIVAEIDHIQPDIQCLIGRDVLSYGYLYYNGEANKYTLAIRKDKRKTV
jgi:predicted aspartyl protease